MKTDTQIYDTVIVEWYDGSEYNRCRFHSCSRQEAERRAVDIGYRKPKWFQFWKRELDIMAYNND
jgi:hypothetical protein